MKPAYSILKSVMKNGKEGLLRASTFFFHSYEKAKQPGRP